MADASDCHRCRDCDLLFQGRFALRRHERDCERVYRRRRAWERTKHARPAQTPEELRVAGDPFEKLKEDG